MRAIFINEGFTYLKPKSRKEIDDTIANMSPSELANLAQRHDKIYYYELALEKGYIPTIIDIENLYSRHRSGFKALIDEYKENFPPATIAQMGIKADKPDTVIEAIEKGYQLSERDKRFILTQIRHTPDSAHNKKWKDVNVKIYNDWNEFINKYINTSGKKKIINRDPEENKKDYNAARKKINDTGKVKDVTTERQEKNGTMQFGIKNSKIGELFSITKTGYVRRHWQGGWNNWSSAPIQENPLLTYQELADILINYLIKNEYIK